MSVMDNTELHSILEHGISKLPEYFKEGHTIAGKHFPALDPFVLDSPLHASINEDKLHLDINIKRSNFLGLSSISPDIKFNVDLDKGVVDLKFMFSEISLKSEDFDLKGDYKVLIRRRKIEAHDHIGLTLKSVCFDLRYKVGVSDKLPELMPDNSSCHIESMDFDLDNHFILERIAKLFKNKISARLATFLEQKTAAFLTQKMAEVCTAHQAVIEKLSRLYAMKKAQGFDIHNVEETPRLLADFGGVGQFPLPLFWELPSVDVNTAPHIRLQDAVAQAETGDVILFAGSADSSKRIRRLTQSRFSHVVVVVKEPGIADGKACIWQATSSHHQGILVDKVRPGIQLNYLDTMVKDYLGEDANAVICLRKLNISAKGREQLQQHFHKLSAFITEMDGKPYTDDMDGLYIMGLMEIDNPNKEDFFCAGLVADALMKLEVLNSNLRQYQYAPRDFSEAQANLPFTDSATHFGLETVITDINADIVR